MAWGLRLAVLLAAACVCATAPVRAEEARDAVGWNERGLKLTEDGRHLEAVEAFVKALDLSPDDAVIRRNLALARSNLAVALLAKGDVDHAAHHAEEALRLQPADPVVVLNLAACRDEQGYPTRAAELVRRARELGPRDADVRERMGAVLYREGDLGGAISEWTVALALRPDASALAERLERARRSKAVEDALTSQLSAHFEVLHDAQSAVLASLVLRELEEAQRVVTAEIQATPPSPVRVVLLSAEEFRETTGASAWVAGLYDGRIRLPVRGVRDRAALLARARHEYVHAALAGLGRRAPSWLHEGLAQVVEQRARADAVARLRRSGAPDFATLSRAFSTTSGEAVARTLYDTALAFVAWLREGERGTRFRFALSRLFADDSLDAAFRAGYDATPAELYEAFRASLR